MVKAGSVTDPAGYAGLANFTIEMLAKGTSSRSALDIADNFDFVGAQFAVKCDYDAAFISLTTLAKDFNRTVPVLFELLTKPAFDSLETGRLKAELLSAIEAKGDRPNTQSAEAFNLMLFKDHPYAHPGMGDAESVSRISRQDLAGYHQKYYAPNNCIISLVGDFKSSQIQKNTGAKSGKLGRPEHAPIDPSGDTAHRAAPGFADKPPDQPSLHQSGISGAQKERSRLSGHPGDELHPGRRRLRIPAGQKYPDGPGPGL